MAVPFVTLSEPCRLVSLFECACGGLNLDPSLPAERVNYEWDRHILGDAWANRIQIAREHALDDIEQAADAQADYWDRMLSGSSPRLGHREVTS